MRGEQQKRKGGRPPTHPTHPHPLTHSPPHTHLQRQAVLERVGAANLVGQAGPPNHHAAAVLRGVLDAHGVLRAGGVGVGKWGFT